MPEFRDETQEIKAMLEAAYAYAKERIEAEVGHLGSIAVGLIERNGLPHDLTNYGSSGNRVGDFAGVA